MEHPVEPCMLRTYARSYLFNF